MPDNEIHATPDMAAPLDPDVMNEWEAFFVQAQVDFDEATDKIKREFNDLRPEAWEPGYQYGKRPSQARIKAAKERQAELVRTVYLSPVYDLAVRLLQATTADPPTLTYVQAARGWFLVDAMLRGILDTIRRLSPKPGEVASSVIDEGVTGLLGSLASDVWRHERLSVLTERDRAMAAWNARHDAPPPLPLPHDGRDFPAAWVMAVADGDMSAEAVAARWLNGEQPG